MDVISKPAASAGAVKLGELIVNRMAFGAMRLCGSNVWGPPKNRVNAHRVLRRALELGINFVDTADSYGPEVSETLIAEALHPYPRDLVIGTKGGLLRPSPPRWDVDARPEPSKPIMLKLVRGQISFSKSTPRYLVVSPLSATARR